jgi:PAS domain S-box-containing protein
MESAVKTIMLVEDEAIVALAKARTLEGLGYRAVTAGTGEAAIEIALDEDRSVDLILMDIDLGRGIDGTETARRILAKRNLPIVFLTGHAEREMVEKVRGITRYGYVVKSSGDFVLQSSIEMAFELFETQEKMRAQETRLRTLLQTIPDLVWLKDTQGIYLSCNAMFERFFGAREADIVGKSDYDFLGKEEADFFREKDRVAMTLGRASMNEEWITFADDGHRARLETIKTPMIDDEGRLIGVLGIGRDITERKRIEEALVESEITVRNKLDAITRPEGDLGSLAISDIIDIPTLRSLMENFSALTGMVVAILDTEGTVLIATGWQDICTRFHRMHPETSAFCTESDLFLAAGVRPGEYVDYKCRNHMWDIVTPLYIESRHIGNIYSGQFFYDDDVVDETVFAAQAEKFGFDREDYLSALRRVPRFSHERITRLMDYLVEVTDFVSRLSYSNLHLARAMAERQHTEELLSKSVKEKEMLLKELQHRVKNSLGLVSSLLSLNMADLRDDDSQRLFQEAVDRIKSIAMIYEELSYSPSIDMVNLGTYIRNLVELLRLTYTADLVRVTTASAMNEMNVELKRAVPLGLIVNELLTNALKYAYPAGESGEIRIDIRDAGQSLELRIADDGPGIPDGLDIRNAKGLGLRIAFLLAEQIGGSLRFESSKGTTAIVSFAKTADDERKDDGAHS